MHLEGMTNPVAFSTFCMKIEKHLITQCIDGDRRAQLKLYDICYSYMMSICIRYCKDKQEAGSRLNLSFLKIIQHLDKYDHNSSFNAWISKLHVRVLLMSSGHNKSITNHQYDGEYAE